jgi:hypothetical protein
MHTHTNTHTKHVCVCVYIYISIYTYRHEHRQSKPTHLRRPQAHARTNSRTLLLKHTLTTNLKGCEVLAKHNLCIHIQNILKNTHQDVPWRTLAHTLSYQLEHTCDVPVIIFLIKSLCPGASMMVKKYFSVCAGDAYQRRASKAPSLAYPTVKQDVASAG